MHNLYICKFIANITTLTTILVLTILVKKKIHPEIILFSTI